MPLDKIDIVQRISFMQKSGAVSRLTFETLLRAKHVLENR